jgi:O-antigen/teichoic acid export membrane protein
MTEIDDPVPIADADEADTAKQIRGSTLLTAGRGISVAINFLVQVMAVRYLTQEAFGAFAYALSITAVIESVVTLGLDRAITRFVPIYEEHREYGKLLGTLVLAFGTVIGLGVLAVVTILALQGWLSGNLLDDPQLVAVLVILAVLAPIQAYDGLLIGLFAVFGNAWAVFFRKHVLAPLLRLAAVAAVIVIGGNVEMLAVGYVLAGLVGVAIYTQMLWRTLSRSGLLARMSAARLAIPSREVLGFALPLLSSDLVFVVLTASDVILLEYFHDTTEVAAFRVVYPAAHLNQIVFTSFALLFTPLAARYFARQDRASINRLYWRTAAWLAVFSFPIFALTFSLAAPLTVALYGERYQDSAVYLALLSIGYYFNVALGFNGLTLKVVGKIRYVVSLNLVAAVANVLVNLLLIPRYGALGAAIGTSGTLVLHNVLKQLGLRFGTGVAVFERSAVRVYVVIIAAVILLLLVTLLVDLSLPAQLAAVTATACAVLILNREALRIADTFPAVSRLPGSRWLFGERR